jgi:hypothetical protein
MTLPEDILIVLVGTGIFALFLLAHFIIFRFLKPEQIFKGIIFIFCLGLLNAGLIAVLVFRDGALINCFTPCALSITIYGLLAFVYILCLFGPYETSIRMRLVRELSQKPQGASLQEISNHYNTAIILDTRLKRLLGAGDLIKDGNVLRIGKQQNAFFAIDAIARQMQAFIRVGEIK